MISFAFSVYQLCLFCSCTPVLQYSRQLCGGRVSAKHSTKSQFISRLLHAYRIDAGLQSSGVIAPREGRCFLLLVCVYTPRCAGRGRHFLFFGLRGDVFFFFLTCCELRNICYVYYSSSVHLLYCTKSFGRVVYAYISYIPLRRIFSSMRLVGCHPLFFLVCFLFFFFIVFAGCTGRRRLFSTLLRRKSRR